MSVSTSVSTLLTVDEYILDAYKKSGLLPIESDIGFDTSWNAKAAHGRKILNRLIEGLSNEGFLEHFITKEIVQMVVGQESYSMDPETLNIKDVGSYIPAYNGVEVLETSGETPVHPYSKYQWQQLSAKSSTGTPTRYFLERNGSDLILHIWPVPSEAGKIRFFVQRIPASNSVGSDNVDLKRHWGDWIVHALAYQLMTDTKMPLEERALMRKDRDDILDKIKTMDTSNEPPDVIFCHSTPWSNWKSW